MLNNQRGQVYQERTRAQTHNCVPRRHWDGCLELLEIVLGDVAIILESRLDGDGLHNLAHAKDLLLVPP